MGGEKNHFDSRSHASTELHETGPQKAFVEACEEVTVTMEALVACIEPDFRKRVGDGVPELFQIAEAAWRLVLDSATTPQHRALLQTSYADQLNFLRSWKPVYLEIRGEKGRAFDFTLLCYKIGQIKTAYEQKFDTLEKKVEQRCLALLEEARSAKQRVPALSAADLRRLLGGELDFTVQNGILNELENIRIGNFAKTSLAGEVSSAATITRYSTNKLTTVTAREMPDLKLATADINNFFIREQNNAVAELNYRMQTTESILAALIDKTAKEIRELCTRSSV